MPADEFETIARLFRPLTRGAPEALDLLDDAAVLAGRPGFDLRRVLCEAECDDAYSRCVGTDHLPPVVLRQSKGRVKDQVAPTTGGAFDPSGGGSLSGPATSTQAPLDRR